MLIGKPVSVLDPLKLREKTMIVFTSDSGTGTVYAGPSTVRGRRLAGEKGPMLEGGALVPLIVNWPCKVSADLIDASDLLPASRRSCRARTVSHAIGCGILDEGDGSGRRKNRDLHERKRQKDR